MMKKNPSWFELFHRNYIENYLWLMIRAYREIPAASRHTVKKENDRRTELVEKMRCYKEEYHIDGHIAYESGDGSKRTDICCYLVGLRETCYICFECKRFLQRDITPSHFHAEYYNEGIKRFEEEDYSREMPQAGMVAFLETGDAEKLKRLMQEKLQEYSLRGGYHDLSVQYRFMPVFATNHQRGGSGRSIWLYHMVLDFT